MRESTVSSGFLRDVTCSSVSVLSRWESPPCSTTRVVLVSVLTSFHAFSGDDGVCWASFSTCTGIWKS